MNKPTYLEEVKKEILELQKLKEAKRIDVNNLTSTQCQIIKECEEAGESSTECVDHLIWLS